MLLKNEGGVLPLKAADLDSVVLIGPTAGQVDAIGLSGERSVGIPQRQVGPLEALKKISGNRKYSICGCGRYDGADDSGGAVEARWTTWIVRTTDGKTQTDAQLNFTGANALAAEFDGDLERATDGAA